MVYIPRTTPLPPSELRQQAYKEAIPPPLPYDDPSGWLSLPQVRVKGMMVTDVMPVEVVYNVRCSHNLVQLLFIRLVPLSYRSQHL